MSADEEMPAQPKTAQLPAADPVQVRLKQMQDAITAAMQAGFRETNANIDLVSGDVKSLKRDVRDLQEWKIAVEGRPAPLTSERAKALIDEHPSQVDMEQQAALAAEIVKNQERDRKRDETHALATTTAEKLDDLKGSQALQLEILKRVDRLFDLVDRVRKHRLTKLIVAIITLALASYAAKRGLLP